MKYLLVALLLGCASRLHAQKRVLDTDVVAGWPHVEGSLISNDGRYLCYYIRFEGRPRLLYVKAIDDGYKMEIPGGQDAAFADDSKKLIFKKGGDSLGVMDLVTRKTAFIPGVMSRQLPKAEKGQWLAYQLLDGELIATNLVSGKKKDYGRVEEYQFSYTGQILIVGRKADSAGRSMQLDWVDLEKGSEKPIYSGGRASHLTFSEPEDRLVFIASYGEGDSARRSICWYNAGEDSARTVAGDGVAGLEAGYCVAAGNPEFSPDGRKVFFYIRQERSAYPPERTGANVEVWSYKDEFLPIPGGGDQVSMFRAVYRMGSGKVLRLQEETDLSMTKVNRGGNDNYLLTASNFNLLEYDLKDPGGSTLYLVNTEDGSRSILARNIYTPGLAGFSPGGQYVYWYDGRKRAYFAYTIKEKACRDISSRIPFPVIDERDGSPELTNSLGLGTWLPGDSGLLIYDHYDIWKVDPNGARPPEDLTGGFGRKNRIVLRCSFELNDFIDERKAVVNGEGDLILCALDENNKDNGFFALDWRHSGRLKQLCMDSALYYFSGASSFANFPILIRKSGNAQRYLLVRERVTEYPNLVVTVDFKRFNAMTDLQPQRGYEWMRGELVRWKTFKGHTGEGILYKPEDFDPAAKYPVILHYYERESDGLNNFLDADLCHGAMNIPWFVSRGYVVFCPDISYTPGNPGAGVYDYVVSAAEMLAAKPWVDGGHMGIQGHSMAGFETNYLVTRTNIFAAASSSAGVSDMISESGEAGLALGAGQPFVENGQLRMGEPFWKNLDAYIQNSAVLQVKKIVTPLLLLHNNGDQSVPFIQSVELFTALRRLGKPAWLLQYEGEGHNIFGESSVDYTIRLTQFFDHYLKGAPEPKWMSQGIPPSFKGIDDGFELGPAKN